MKHYHIIFTVPHCLNELCLWNQSMYYSLLFRTVWRTLHSFGYTHYGVETGAIAVLHTWGQNLSLHPHIHCIVPAAGYSLKGEWRHIGRFENYLYPVHQLSDTFKGKFPDSLKRKLRNLHMPDAFNAHIQKAYNSRWVVHSEPSLAGAEHVVRYLGQYTHRVAITNQRILNISDTHVTFITKDYRDRAQNKPARMDRVEFLRRFCMHILPQRFVRIRRFGIYNPTAKRNLDLQFILEQKPDIEQLYRPKESETTSERIKRLTGFDIQLCPVCKKGRMHLVREIPRIRSPAGHLPTILVSMLQ
ncbi:transposase [Bacteroidota bacterium]